MSSSNHGKDELRRKLSRKWKENLVSYADKYCQDIGKRLNGYVVRHTNDYTLEVDNEIERRIINLERTL